MLTQEQITICVNNPAWTNRVGEVGNVIIKADRCEAIGDHTYTSNWVRPIACDSLTRVKKSEAATINIYSLDGTPEHYHDPVSLKHAVSSGKRINIIATLTSPENLTRLSGPSELTEYAQAFARTVTNASYTPVILMFDEQKDVAYKFACPYTPERGRAGEGFIIKTALESDERVNSMLYEGASGHLWAQPGVAINMSQTSIKTWLNNQLLKPTASSSNTTTPYRMGTHIMNTISNDMYAPVAATIKRSKENPKFHYLSEITPIVNKAQSRSLRDAMKIKMQSRAH